METSSASYGYVMRYCTWSMGGATGLDSVKLKKSRVRTTKKCRCGLELALNTKRTKVFTGANSASACKYLNRKKCLVFFVYKN